MSKKIVQTPSDPPLFTITHGSLGSIIELLKQTVHFRTITVLVLDAPMFRILQYLPVYSCCGSLKSDAVASRSA